MGKKLVVLFPGAGYHCDKPLLYYTKKMAKKYDYKVVELSFELSEAASAIKGDREKTRMALDTAFARACGKLGDIDFGRYDRVIFVGKSIGTAVMARYSAEYSVNAETVIFTPIAETFEHTGLRGPVFHGSADPLLDTEKCLRLCEERGLPCTVIPKANHSLETGDVEKDIKNLGKVMKTVDGIFRRE